MPRNNQLRIIGGTLRGRRLTFTAVGGLRPTADRLRETLFNWLQHDIEGAHCLDLFAGSGALGIEALSRGAADVTFVERAQPAVRALQRNLVAFGIADRARVIRGDARRELHRRPEPSFDVVFVDPPFASGLMAPVCDTLAAQRLVADQGLVYQEQDGSDAWPEPPPGWIEVNRARAGQAQSRLLRVGAC